MAHVVLPPHEILHIVSVADVITVAFTMFWLVLNPRGMGELLGQKL